MRCSNRFSAVLLIPMFLSLSGCAARLTEFNTFAQAGITYVTASQTVIQAAGTATVNTDSAVLIKARKDLKPDDRESRIKKSDQLLKQRLELLELVATHGRLLQAYFQALADLSDPKATDSVGTAAQGVFNALSSLSPTLKAAKIGSTSVSDFIPQVSAPIVATFKARALNKELKARSTAIANELALQEAAFKAIESELKTDVQEQRNLAETDSISQFASDATLPAGWASQRLGILSPPAEINAADAAAKAAAGLRNAFTEVVENRLDSASFASLMNDISNMIIVGKTIQSGLK